MTMCGWMMRIHNQKKKREGDDMYGQYDDVGHQRYSKTLIRHQRHCQDSGDYTDK